MTVLTIVTGPPCAGKTTHVRTHAKPGDIVVDYDQIAQALGSPDTHDHPAPIAYVAKAARQTAIRAAIGCHRRGSTVWIIDTAPSPHRQHQYAKAGAKVITLTAPADELHRRAQDRPEAWHALIDQWLADHEGPNDHAAHTGTWRPRSW
ncbi:AAA family ATPase [Actinomadura sp. 9N215]|uniref:AAA family ATPase n=1 Tax=Actinomadura sp. 9N215 TaxID=3375150 RepID=UPI0037A63B99